jgi:hypothetical protein
MKKSTSFILSILASVALFAPTAVLAVTPSSTPSVVVETKNHVATGAMEAKEGEMEKKVEYALPYPGILPDHSLYFLKKLRDQIMERLISDPTRKIEFYVLQSDKELNAGIFLIAKNKQDLAGETLANTGVFMERAVKAAAAMKAQGKTVPGYILEKLTNSLGKHVEVLTELLDKSSENQKGNITKALEVVSRLQGEVSGLK